MTEKLGKNNFPLWKAQVLSAIRGAEVAHFLDAATAGEPPKFIPKAKETPDELIINPEHLKWVAKDQQIFNYLISSVSRDVQVQIASCTTAAEIWKAILDMTASQSRGRVINTRMAMATAQKGSSTIADFFSKMKGLADDMAAAGKKLDDEEIASYILAGLDRDFDPVVSGVSNRDEPVSLGNLYTQLVSWEQRINFSNGGGDNSSSSANAAARGGRGGFKRGGGSRGRNNGRGRSNNGNGGRPRQKSNEECQLCGLEGHTVLRCYKRFNASFQGPAQEKRQASSATAGYGVDTNWYTDTGATDHITGELEKLIARDKYHGTDQVHTANGAGMRINQIGQSIVHTPNRNLVLKNVLYVPEANKNLASVHCLTSDNNAFIEYHPDHFLIKDQVTRKTLVRGGCEGGLYPLKSFRSTSNKVTHAAIKPSTSRWHSRLGHPSSSIVQQVLSKNNVPFVSESNKEQMCDACQLGKSHQLPYPVSTSVSSSPLELIFSDVWGPASTSINRHNYYVSFIDDFSKFTWIYLLRHKSEVFQKFHDFQSMVERQFDRKILSVQTDWRGEYQKLNTFFQRIGINHHVSCPHAHQQNGSAERKHRHIVEVGLSLLAHASMPLKFWDEAFLTATYLINRLPSKVIHHQTPLERLFGHKPDYLNLRTFGCACWPNLRPFNAKKLQFRSKQCVFLGYSTMHKGFKCLDVAEGRVYISRDVIFDETVYPFSKLHPNAGARLRSDILLLPTDLLNPSSGFGGEHTFDSADNDSLHTNPCNEHADSPDDSASDGANPRQTGRDFMQVGGFPFSAGTGANPGTDLPVDPPASATTAGESPLQSTPVSSTAPSSPPSPSVLSRSVLAPTAGRQGQGAPAPSSMTASGPSAPSSTHAGGHTRSLVADPVASAMAPPPPADPPRPRTRLQHEIRKPKQYTDGTVRYGHLAVTPEESPTLKSALADPNWRKAMDAEFLALQKNKTWHLVPPQKGKNVVDCKWVYKIKRRSDGKIDRYKARLVAKGFKQRYGID